MELLDPGIDAESLDVSSGGVGDLGLTANFAMQLEPLEGPATVVLRPPIPLSGQTLAADLHLRNLARLIKQILRLRPFNPGATHELDVARTAEAVGIWWRHRDVRRGMLRYVGSTDNRPARSLFDRNARIGYPEIDGQPDASRAINEDELRRVFEILNLRSETDLDMLEILSGIIAGPMRQGSGARRLRGATLWYVSQCPSGTYLLDCPLAGFGAADAGAEASRAQAELVIRDCWTSSGAVLFGGDLLETAILHPPDAGEDHCLYVEVDNMGCPLAVA